MTTQCCAILGKRQYGDSGTVRGRTERQDMTSRERVLLAMDHQEAYRLPVFKPNVIQTHEPFEDRVRKFMDRSWILCQIFWSAASTFSIRFSRLTTWIL